MLQLVTKFSIVSRDLIKLFGSGKTFRSITFSEHHITCLPAPKYDLSYSLYEMARIVKICPPIIVNFNLYELPDNQLCQKLICKTFWHTNGYFDKIIRLPPANPQVRYICPYFDDLLWIHFILNQNVCLLTYLLKPCCTWSREDF